MPKVVFKQSGLSIACETGDYLLDLCESRDGAITFSCRAGACGACMIDGMVDDAKALLLAKGMSADAIHHEQFY